MTHSRGTSPGATPPSRFDDAVRLHLAGDLEGAERAYASVIAANPRCAEAYNNKGTIHAGRGEHAAAIPLFRRASELHGDYADAFHNLGLVLAHAGCHAEASVPLERAVRIDGARPTWWADLGNVLVQAQQNEAALVAYDRALALAPGDAGVLANRASALRGLRRHDEAIGATRGALAQRPDDVGLLQNLGLLLKEVRAFDEARAVLTRARGIAPSHAGVMAHLAMVHLECGELAEARALAETLVQAQPDDAEGWNVLGLCHAEAAELAEAEHCHREALARRGDDRNAAWNLAVLTLLRGDLRAGFQLFERRKEVVSPFAVKRHFNVPEWDGSPLDGCTVLLHAEQGIGDLVQFVRYAPLVRARGAERVILECPPPAVELLRGAPCIDNVIAAGAPRPPVDVHAYLMSLPHYFDTTLDAIPADVPYLTVAPGAAGELVRTQGSGVRVGLAWAGNPSHQRDRMRSMPLAALAPLFTVPGVTFYSLQRDAAAGQLATYRAEHPGAPLVDLAPELPALTDMASAIAALDLVITVDTAVAHLAGALGVPVWLMLSHVPDWRWMLDRDDSPWYPSMRLVRQPTVGSWAPVVDALVRALGDVARGERAANAHPRVAAAVPAPARVASPADDPVGAPKASAPERRVVEVSWPVGLSSGWGTYGMHLALGLARSSRAEPVLAVPPVLEGASPLVARALSGLSRTVRPSAVGTQVRLEGLGNGFTAGTPGGDTCAANRAGIVFFEDTRLDAAALARARSYDVMIAGSSWNAALMNAWGIPNVKLVLQGVDPAVFHPAPASGVLADRFLVFSGGKLEYRKGQDIVVEAFRRFSARHPEAMLVTAWHNHWPATMAGIEQAGHVRRTPEVRGGRCEVLPWLAANGIPQHVVLDLGVLPHAAMAQVLHDMDVAVFPNRCEGGTNLVAMEAMACGVPSILSANTGHLNLIGEATCFVLERQGEVAPPAALAGGTLGWGESDPAELDALLERVFTDRAEARRRGEAGARLLAQLPWPVQAEALLDAVLGEAPVPVAQAQVP